MPGEPLSDNFVYQNLIGLLSAVMRKFPGQFEDFVNLLASPEPPVFSMTTDEKRFAALESTISHIGATKLVVEVERKAPVLFNDQISLIWLKIEDPNQLLDKMLMNEHEMAFNDTVRQERYFTTESTVVNLAYSPSGSAILTIFSRSKGAIERYMETTEIRLEPFVTSMLKGVA